jgi:[ribosomal protein S18]-alanine N-acetyltransferase
MTAVARRALVVRGAEERDLEQVAAIERSAFSDPWTRDALASALHLAHIRFLVAEETEGSPVGGGADGVTLAGYVVALVMGEEGEIADLAVAPAARRRGVGSLLLGRMEQELASCGVRSLYLEVRDSNLAALALYRAHRFEAVGRRRGYYRNPSEDALVLKCDLARA